MRLLFYAVNGLGLGHVTRLLGLARAVRAQEPNAEILFLTSSEASHLIYREGFAAVKVPSRTSAKAGGLRGGSFLRLTQSVVWSAMSAFDPHCLVVDTFAAGALQELLPLLRWPLRKVFVFRAQRLDKAQDSFFQSTLRFYDLILVPHEAGSEEVPTPAGVRAVWTGPMLCHGPDEMLKREAARAKLELPQDGTIGLLTLGGGGEPEAEAAYDVLEAAISQHPGALWVQAEGPLSRDVQKVRPWRVMREVHPLMLYLNAFDCAISAVGYNTTHELQAARVPCGLWPFARDVDDQAARAEALAAQGCALSIGEGASAPQRAGQVAQVVGQLLQPSTREELRAGMTRQRLGGTGWRNGTEAGARAILELIRG